jgi:hypothetical protein
MSTGVSVGVGHGAFSGPFDAAEVTEAELKSRREYATSHGAEGPFRIGVTNRKDHLESEHAYHVRPAPLAAAEGCLEATQDSRLTRRHTGGCRRDIVIPTSCHRC